MKADILKQRVEAKAIEVIDFYRGIVLDTVEQEIGDGANWSFIRARLLKAFGDRGLVGRLREVISNEFRNTSTDPGSHRV